MPVDVRVHHQLVQSYHVEGLCIELFPVTIFGNETGAVPVDDERNICL